MSIALGSTMSLACSPQVPFDESIYKSDLIFVGKAIKVGEDRGSPFAQLRVTEVFVGHQNFQTYRVDWGNEVCVSRGPPITAGQRVIVYLVRSNGKLFAQQWKIVGRTGVNPREIRSAAADAERREQRQKSFFRLRSALARNDRSKWIVSSDYPFELRGQRRSGVVQVNLTVSDHGVLLGCGVVRSSGTAELDDATCVLIGRRAQLVPPIYPEERRGTFTHVWHPPH